MCLGPGYKDRPSAGAAWGRVGPVRAEWGWGGVGHALGFNYITPRLGPGARKVGPRGAGWGRVGSSGAEYGRVGPVRVEWGWGGVGHALGNYSETTE